MKIDIETISNIGVYFEIEFVQGTRTRRVRDNTAYQYSLTTKNK